MAGPSPWENLIMLAIGISLVCNLTLNSLRHPVSVSIKPNWSWFDQHLPNRFSSGVSMKLCTSILRPDEVLHSQKVLKTILN